MNWDVVHVETTAPLALQVQFADGTAGKVQFEPHGLDSSRFEAGNLTMPPDQVCGVFLSLP